MWRWLLALVVLGGVALGIVFGVLNPDIASLNLIAFTWTSTLGAIVSAAFGAGVLVGFLAMLTLRLLRRPKRRQRAGSGDRPSGHERLVSDG